MNCPICESNQLTKKGTIELASGTIKQRYKCKDCGEHFSVAHADEHTEDMFAEEVEHVFDLTEFRYERSEAWLKSNVYSHDRLIITAAQCNTPVDQDFLSAIDTYRKHKPAGLIAIPIKYKTVNSQDDSSVDMYDESIEQFLCENTLTFSECNVKVYAGLKIQATAENPLSGLDPLSKGWTVIVGHAQVQLKTLPNLDKRISDILTTTGAITEKNYSKTKLGEKARFNHSLSALVIEFVGETYHLRHLNYSPETKSFWDIETEYRADGTTHTESVEALVTGDEHALFRDPVVENFTYTDANSLVNTLKPKYIVRHDVLDFYSGSHHHAKNIFVKFAKHHACTDDVELEVLKTIDYINDTTPAFSTSLIVKSNHNEHLLRWLNEVDIQVEPWNAKFYHLLMYMMLSNTKLGDNGSEYPDPFELYSTPRLKKNVSFIQREYRICDIVVGMHGDIGINGARGSFVGFSRLPNKSIVGHSHSPRIEKGCYVVGTSSKLQLEYNKGASTWHHAHCVIHPNGKRQLIFIKHEGWRLI